MVGTIAVCGSRGEVMAPIIGRSGEFIRGRPRLINVTQIGSDEDVPLAVREDLVGIKVRTIFDRCYLGKGFHSVLAEGSLVAYIEDVVDALRAAGKDRAASALWGASGEEPLAFYVFDPGTFELVMSETVQS